MEKMLLVEIWRKKLYGAGELSAMIYLPAEDYKLRDAYERARIPSQEEVSLNIAIYSCNLLPELMSRDLHFSTAPKLEELNYFAKRLTGLSAEERVVFRTLALKLLEDNPQSGRISIKDLINSTYDLDKIPILPGIKNDEELGEYVIKHKLDKRITKIPNKWLPLLDRAKIGEQQRQKDGGAFMAEHYVMLGKHRAREIYDGHALPKIEAPPPYAFRLKIARDSNEDKAMWISLPIDNAKANEMAKTQGADKIEDCICLEFESTVAQIKAEQFQTMTAFEDLNHLAGEILEMSASDEVKFKAILSIEEPTTVKGILETVGKLHCYELDPEIETGEEYLRKYLSLYVNNDFDKSWLKMLRCWDIERELTSRLGVKATAYGLLSDCGRSLYEPVSYMEKPVLERKFETIDIFDQTALYSRERVMCEAVPEGLYKYDLQRGRSGSFERIAEEIISDYGGTILINKPLDFNGKSHQVFDECSAPKLLDYELTAREYQESEPLNCREDQYALGGQT